MQESVLLTWIQANIDAYIEQAQRADKQPFTEHTEVELLVGAAAVFESVSAGEGLFGTIRSCLDEEHPLILDALVAFDALGNPKVVDLIERGRAAYEQLAEAGQESTGDSARNLQVAEHADEIQNEFDQELYILGLTDWVSARAAELLAAKNAQQAGI